LAGVVPFFVIAIYPLYRAPDSLVVTDFPARLAEFREKRFTLLWRDSRFGAGFKRCEIVWSFW
jgi:hypothetical protein